MLFQFLVFPSISQITHILYLLVHFLSGIYHLNSTPIKVLKLYCCLHAPYNTSDGVLIVSKFQLQNHILSFALKPHLNTTVIGFCLWKSDSIMEITLRKWIGECSWDQLLRESERGKPGKREKLGCEADTTKALDKHPGDSNDP